MEYVLSFFFLFINFATSLTPDGLSLLALKSAVESDPTRVMTSWSESDQTPCHWPGIICTQNRVTSLILSGRRLSGYIPSELGLLDSLTRLDLARNNFTKPIPTNLFNAINLNYIDLSHNSITGPIPAQIKALNNHLSHLDLSSNQLNGSLPDSLTQLTSLVGTLNLSYNRFSGQIPPSYGEFPVFVSLDLGHNNLTGKIPQIGSLLNQGPTAFAGNSDLCGFPLQKVCKSETLIAPKPEGSQILEREPNPSLIDREKKPVTGSVTVSLISGVSIVIGAVSISIWLIRRKRSLIGSKSEKLNKIESDLEEEDEEEGKFVAIDEGFELELEDLLRASAYVIGKSRSGIVYRVVSGMGSGTVAAAYSLSAAATVVAVRRLSDGDATWRRKDFVNEVEAIGRVHHPNIVRLRAYYYAEDERLLITDYVRNGSLYSALHGGSSNTLPSLSWSERLRIAQGTARGLMYIHEYSPRKYVHGNLKSTKILLDDELQPRISGFGLTRLVSGYSKLTASVSTKRQSLDQSFLTSSATVTRITAPSVAYLAPEARANSGYKLSQKCDVYSFGVVLMELLTGRQPNASSESNGEELVSIVKNWVKEEKPLADILDPEILNKGYVDKQVIAAIHVALNCTEMDPELRPRMRSVSESLGRIKSV